MTPRISLSASSLALLLLLHGLAWAGPAEDQYAVAATQYSQRQWKSAVDEFEVFLRDNPTHERRMLARFFAAEALVQLGNYPASAQHLEKFLAEAPTHQYARQAMFRLGESYYLQGKRDDARRWFDSFTKNHADDPLDAFVLAYQGELSLESRDLTAARTQFESCLKRFPTGPMADTCNFGLARVQESNDPEGSAKRYEKIAANRTSQLADDAQLQLGLLSYNQKQFEASAKSLSLFDVEEDKATDKIFSASPLKSYALHWRGMALVAQAKWPEAAAALDRASSAMDDQHPLAPRTMFYAADAWRQAGKREQASDRYEKLAMKWPNCDLADDAMCGRLQLAAQADQHDTVAVLSTLFRTQFAESDLGEEVRQIEGRSLLKQGKFKEAVALLETASVGTKAGDPKPDDAKATAVKTPKASFAVTSYLLSVAQLGAGDPEQSLKTLETIESQPTEPELTRAILAAKASTLMALKRHDAAAAAIKAYLAVAPQGVDAARCRADLAICAIQAEKLGDAQAALAELKKHHPDHPLLASTSLRVAEAAYASGQRAEAAVLFRDVASQTKDPELASRALSGLAWSQMQLEQPKESAATFDELLQKYPSSPLAVEAAMARAEALLKLKQPDGALAMYHLVIEKHEKSGQVPQALLAAAKLHQQLQQHDQAEKLLARLAKEFPQSGQNDAGLYQRAWSLVDLGRQKEADALFATLHKSHRDSRYWPDATYRLAQQAFRANQLDDANQLTQVLLDTKPEGDVLCHVLYLRSQIAAQQNRWADLQQPLAQLVKLFPDHELRLPAEYWQAEAKYRLGKYQESGTLFAELSRKVQGRKDNWLGMVPLRQAQVLAQDRQWEEALEIAQTIAQKFPDFRQQYEADYLLGRCHAAQARFDEARLAYRRVVDSPTGGKSESAAMAQWMIGESFLHQKKYEEAIKAYTRVEALYAYPQWQAAAVLQMGKCHELLGQHDEAVRRYAHLLKQYGETTYAGEGARRLRAAEEESKSPTRR